MFNKLLLLTLFMFCHSKSIINIDTCNDTCNHTFNDTCNNTCNDTCNATCNATRNDTCNNTCNDTCNDICNDINYTPKVNSSCLTCKLGVGLIIFENNYLNYTLNQTKNSIQKICNNSSISELIAECYYLHNNTFRILNFTKHNHSISDICSKIQLC